MPIPLFYAFGINYQSLKDVNICYNLWLREFDPG